MPIPSIDLLQPVVPNSFSVQLLRVRTLKSLKLTNKLQFIYEFWAEDNLLPFICKFQATERGRAYLLFFRSVKAVQRERHICMPISAPHTLF